MSSNRWLWFSLAVTVSVGLTVPAYAQSNEGSGQGNWLYEGRKAVLDAEKKAAETKPEDSKESGSDSAKTAEPAKSETKTEGAAVGDKDYEHIEDKKDEKKDGEKKADGEKTEEKDKKLSEEDKKKEEQKKAEEKKKEEQKKAEEDKKKEEEKKAEAEKKKEAEKLVYDPLKDAMFDLNTQKYDDGIAKLKKLLGSNPKNVNAHYLLAVTYVMKRQYPLAVEQYKTVLQLAPKSNIAKLAEEGLSKIHQ